VQEATLVVNEELPKAVTLTGESLVITASLASATTLTS